MSNEEKIQLHLNKYLLDPTNPDLNFWLGYEYEEMGQYASAHTYYLRCAELTQDKDLQYECLLKTYTTIAAQERRSWYERQQLLLAITHSPKRPEAYYILSLMHSWKQEWKEALMYATIALEICNFDKKTKTFVKYDGETGLILQKAFTLWYVGQKKESIHFWKKVYTHPQSTNKQKEIAITNFKDLFKFSGKEISSFI
jgi:tetratricopeptide (TPR) repeat protein